MAGTCVYNWSGGGRGHVLVASFYYGRFECDYFYTRLSLFVYQVPCSVCHFYPIELASPPPSPRFTRL